MVELHHPEHGSALIRDNKPINERALRNSLTDTSSREWYETLNRRVFFWVDEERLSRLVNARAYRDREHLVLEVDARKLVERHHNRIRISTLNTGAAFPLGAPSRGSDTFRMLEEYPLKKPVVELTVDHSVPDIREFIVRRRP